MLSLSVARIAFFLLLVLGTCKSEYYGKEIGSFTNTIHDVSGTVYAVDWKRIQITNFNYDGEGPDAFFWAGQRGSVGPTPDKDGGGIIVPNEHGSMLKLAGYTNKDIVLVLPGSLQITDLVWLSVYCREFKANFGHVTISESFEPPASVNIGPFSQLAHKVKSEDVILINKKQITINKFNYDGLGPDAYFLVGPGSEPVPADTKVPDETGSLDKARGYTDKTITLTLPGDLTVDDIGYLSMYCIDYKHNFGQVILNGPYDVPPYIKDWEQPAVGDLKNCMGLNDNFNVAWEVKDTDVMIELSGKIEDTQYLAFGISGSPSSSVMVGGDVVVVYMQEEASAVDYTLGAKSPCSVGSGVCPDTDVTNGKNDVELIEGERRDGIIRIKYKRPLDTGDSNDKVISTNSDTYVIWAIGPLRDNKVTKHTVTSTGNIKINFGADIGRNCPALGTKVDEMVKPWDIQPIRGEDTKEFVMEIGSAGLDRGYSAITGYQSWGIAWYVNQKLIPELILKRGEEFTFKIYGGNNKGDSAKYHPFYITDDPIGGYAQTKRSAKVYAGVGSDDEPTANAVGPYCEWLPKGADQSAKYDTFKDYFKTLTKTCASGEPGIIKWTPDEKTADLVYYQCYTHEHLGWKIRVVDEYPLNTSASPRPILSVILIAIIVV